MQNSIKTNHNKIRTKIVFSGIQFRITAKIKSKFQF